MYQNLLFLMFYNTYYSKFVSKGVYFLGTFQKWIFKVLERIFHVISSVPKGVPFETNTNKLILLLLK
ncbi:hypothetical protein COL31_10840 [Bacillus pseudomycoides]|nr:hypothetical protein COL31_10840 [Bacillus pseudomycoides]PFZ83142.1 hypothetical protein COL69_12020 [Bacillus pseudomycoides]PGE11997.1 hypothetical protein COM51_24040 [Bacillus pseudomycoides]